MRRDTAVSDSVAGQICVVVVQVILAIEECASAEGRGGHRRRTADALADPLVICGVYVVPGGTNAIQDPRKAGARRREGGVRSWRSRHGAAIVLVGTG